MGSIVSKKPQSDIDIQLAKDKEDEKYNQKILLLGTGESGKSTVVKQVKMIYSKGSNSLSDREKIEYITAIRRNCIEAIQTLLEASTTLCIPLNDSNLNDDFEKVKNLEINDTLDEKIAISIDNLWNDGGIQTVFQNRDKFWNMDATPYYLREVHRIADADYEPTEEDCVMTRVRTTGIVVTQINEAPYTYQVVDVGGQRSERRKWIHAFDDVKGVIFLDGLAGYNQVLFEDSSVNRMHESLNLFREIVKNPIFKKIPIFVFLNKKDLFEEMIPKYPLSKCFPEFQGPPGDIISALEFIQQQYLTIMEEECPGKQLYIQIIAARVRLDMKIAFGEVKETLKKLYPVK